jgi:hypothetical protein
MRKIMARNNPVPGCVGNLGCIASIWLLYGVAWCIVTIAKHMTSVSALFGAQLTHLADGLSWLHDWSPIATMCIALFLWLALLAPTQAILIARAARWAGSPRVALWFVLALFEGMGLLLVAKGAQHVSALARWPLVGDDWRSEERCVAMLAVLLGGALLWYLIAALFKRRGNTPIHESAFRMRALSDGLVKLPVFVSLVLDLGHHSLGGGLGLLVGRGFFVAGCGAYVLTMWIARRRMAAESA